MTPELIAVLMFGLLVCGLFMGHPLAFVLGGTAVLTAIIAGKPMVLGIVINRIYGDVLDNYTLIAIPLFVLMARFLSDSGVTDRMFETLRLLLSRVRGGLALAVVFISILLAATTGIIGASITVMGVMALRPMLQYGYSQSLTTGVIAASGCLGILIPPSIMLILMASYSPLSVGELFAGSMIPGVLLGLSYALYVYVISVLRPDLAPAVEPDEKTSRGELMRMLVIEALPPLLLIFGILGSLLAGIATATEASAIAASCPSPSPVVPLTSAAAGSAQKAFAFEVIKIAMNGHFRDTEQLGQFIKLNSAIAHQCIKDLLPAVVSFHRVSFARSINPARRARFARR